jgi:hypothetical protein
VHQLRDVADCLCLDTAGATSMLTDDLPAPQCERALTSIFLFCGGGASGKPASAMLVLLLASLLPHSALAHGIAGNRYFDATMTFDDPSVADEAILPYYANSAFPAQGSNTSRASSSARGSATSLMRCLGCVHSPLRERLSMKSRSAHQQPTHLRPI